MDARLVCFEDGQIVRKPIDVGEALKLEIVIEGKVFALNAVKDKLEIRAMYGRMILSPVASNMISVNSV